MSPGAGLGEGGDLSWPGGVGSKGPPCLSEKGQAALRITPGRSGKWLCGCFLERPAGASDFSGGGQPFGAA